MFEPVKNEVIQEWRKFREETLHNFYLSQSIIKIIIQENEMRKDIRSIGKNRSAYKVLVRKSKGKLHIERHNTI
jgi:hypothetical protein